MQAIGRAGTEPWSRAKVKKIMLSWHTYLLPLCYVLWNNGNPQLASGYWYKSFNKKPHPVPGHTYTVAQINDLPLPTTGIAIVMALTWAWISDGVFRGRRWPFIYGGAVVTVSLYFMILDVGVIC